MSAALSQWADNIPATMSGMASTHEMRERVT